LEGMTNVVELCGTLADKPKFSHTGGSDNYFSFPLDIERLSGFVDTINIIARQDIISRLEIDNSSHLAITGELRSFNNKRGDGSRLVISVLAKDIYFTDDEDKNLVLLTGAVCKRPNLRKTPMGRQICDIMLAVNRRYGRSDYLPCIAWGRLAESTAELKVGDVIALEGRIQSRKYIKTENGIMTERTAFEVSIVSITP
jgi:single-strand DNA-binding protein